MSNHLRRPPHRPIDTAHPTPYLCDTQQYRKEPLLTSPTPTTPATTAATEPYPLRWRALGVLVLSLVLIGLDNTILNVALPTLVREINVTNSQLQWIIDSYVLVFAGLLLTAGSLGDRFGRKGALNAGLIIFAVAAVIAANTSSAAQLIAARALMGIGGAFIMPATLSILTNMFPPSERGRAIGIWAGGAGIGIPIGPLLGGWLLEHAHWSSIFYVNVPVVVVALIAGAWLLPTSRDRNAPRIDVVGALLSIAALVALVSGIIEAPHYGWLASETLLALGSGLVLLAAFAWWEARIKEPMLDMRFFRNARFSAANAAITFVFFALFGSLLALTQYLQLVRGYSPFEAGVRMLPVAAGMLLGAPTSARVAERVGTKFVVVAGLCTVALGLILLSRLTTTSEYPQVAAALAVMALGMGFSMAPATEAVMGAIPRSRAGVGSAMNDTTRQVGGALGVAIIGSLTASVYRDRVAEALANLPAPALEAAQNSLGAALRVAASLGPNGAAVADIAREAFIEAMRTGLQAAALVAIAGALIALVFLPAHGEDAGEDFIEA